MSNIAPGSIVQARVQSNEICFLDVVIRGYEELQRDLHAYLQVPVRDLLSSSSKEEEAAS